MRKRIGILLLLFVSCNITFAQTDIIQTFFNLAEKEKANQKYEDAIYWYSKALDKAIELNINSDLSVSICYLNIGESYAFLGDSLSCMINMAKAVEEAERWINKDDYLFAIILGRRAQAMVNINNPADAIPLFKEATKILEKCSWEDFAKDGYVEPDIEYVYRYSEALYWTGSSYEVLNDHRNALKYFELAHGIVSNKVSNKDISADSPITIIQLAGNINFGIVSCCMELSKEYFEKQEIDKAIQYYEQAYNMMKACPNAMLCVIGSYQQDVLIRLIESCKNSKRDIKKYIRQYYDIEYQYQKILSNHYNYSESNTSLSVFFSMFDLARKCKDIGVDDAELLCMDLGLSTFEKGGAFGEDYAYALYTYANWLDANQFDIESALRYDKKSLDVLFENKPFNDSLLFEFIEHTSHRYSAFAERPYYQGMADDNVKYRKYKQLSPVWREILLDLYENLGQTSADSILYQIALKDSSGLGRYEHPFLHCRGLASEYLSEILISIMQGESKVGDLMTQLREELEIENNHYLYPYALAEIAGLYLNEGYPVQSKGIFSAAYSLSIQHENLELCDHIALRLCSALFSLGEYEKAVGILSYWDDADYEDANTFIEAQLLFCEFYQRIDDYEKALKHAIAALDAYDSNKEHDYLTTTRSSILTKLGETYAGLNQFDKAQNCYDEAMSLYKENQNSIMPPLSLWMHNAVLAFKQGDYDKAKDDFNALLEETNKWSPSSSWLCYHYLCEISIKQGDIEKAERYLDQFWRINSENVLGLYSVMTEDERETYWRKTSDLVGYYGVRALQNEPALNSPFFNLVLSDKGQLINTNLIIESNVKNSNNKQLVDSYQMMKLTRNEPDSLRYFYARQFISLYNREFSQNDMIIIWQDIQNKLSRNDCVIEFVKCQDRDNAPCIGALILKKSYKIPALIKLCDCSELEEIFKQGKNMYLDESMLKIYDFIWKPLEPHINKNDNVYFSPVDLLHLINLEILCDHNGDRVCDIYKLHRVSSSRQLCIKKKKVKYSSIAIYGGLQYEMTDAEMIAQKQKYLFENEIASRGFVTDTNYRAGWKYLLGTKEEASIISDNLKKHKIEVLAYYGTDGTEESFKSLSSKNIQIIHLATHGFFFKNEEIKGKAFFENQRFDRVSFANNRLKRSGLVMAGGQRAWLGDTIPANVDDGILLAEEIAAMNLSGTDLVVLSACETGLGDITSDGVFGLQRAFKMAGVQTLVMSLWKVDDNATSLMMQTFYEHLLSGVSKREAFNLAQATVRARYPEPYYWAGFVMLD